MTPAGIEPATFGFVAQHLNYSATAVPSSSSSSNNNNNNTIVIINISFMQGIYTYIPETNYPETNYVPREYSVAAILLLLFMVLTSLVSVLNLMYFYISTFRSMSAVPNMAVFCSSLTSCFPGMLLTYFLNDIEIVPVAPITGITFVFTFHMRCISIVRSLYFRIFSASFLITFLSLEIATSINIHVPVPVATRSKA